jgi:hypothetical protein
LLAITFVHPASGELGVVAEAGLWVSNAGGDIFRHSTTVQFLDADGQVLESVVSSGKWFFAGARSRKGIARIVLTDPDGFIADDLQFSRIRRIKTPAADHEDSLRVPKPKAGRLIF